MKQMYKLFSPRSRQKALEAVRQAPEHWIVEVKPRTRSLEQNAMLWRLLTITANNVAWPVNGTEIKLTPDDWKDIFTASLHQEKRIAKGVQGGFVMLGRSTSVMTIPAMTELIEFIHSFLAEQGVSVDVQEQEIA
jgi:hypothetical protein